MKAIRVHTFGNPEVLTLEHVPDPVAGHGEVLVRVAAAGVNPVDTYIRSGTYARKPALPYTPGTDAAGTIEAVGQGVTGHEPGQRVWIAALLAARCTGTYAELVACDAAAVHRLPPSVRFSQGAALGVPYTTAYRALIQRAWLAPGESVLVHGASGSVGLASVQFARALGARIVGTAGSQRGRELVSREGADLVLDHTAPDYLDPIMTFTGGRGVEVIIEMLANVNLERDFAVLAPYGRIVIVGSRGSLEFTPRLAMAKEATVLGTTLWNVPSADAARALAAVTAGLDAGFLKPVVAAELPLVDAPAAHRQVLAPGAHGKIVLVPR